MFWIFKKVCRFVQDWIGVISFTLARACSVLILTGAVTILSFVLFGQMASQYRISLLYTVIVASIGGYKTLGYVDYVERNQRVYTKNSLPFDPGWQIVRVFIVLVACIQIYSGMKDAQPGDEQTRDSVMCIDILTVMIWTVVAFMYFVSINPDPLGPSRINRAIRRLFPQSA
jgi:hypothetical protein